jgi:hypothetical protein
MTLREWSDTAGGRACQVPVLQFGFRLDPFICALVVDQCIIILACTIFNFAFSRTLTLA